MEENGCHLEESLRYCVCRKPYEDDQFMIECDICNEWFHGSCVGVSEAQSSLIDKYHCPRCWKTHGPFVLKARPQTFHLFCRPDIVNMSADNHIAPEKIASIAKTKTHAGSPEFILELLKRKFLDASCLPVTELRGYQLTCEYLATNGFDKPILVRCKDGLDLRVPIDDAFSAHTVEELVGSLKEVDVIDVAKQEEVQMFMREWVEYFSSSYRPRILNLLSLEFTGTKLADIVEPPRIVHDLSWINNHWPSDIPVEDLRFVRPEVQRYCLMGTKNSYTDFHVDFGGTSVWYHILQGEKIFYLIPPTRQNLAKYESWFLSSDKSETFLGDLVDECYRCVIKSGETVFLPSGWIHAVFTPVDSIVFGGNFLHSFNIRRQLKIYEMEKRLYTPVKYLFPNFETIHWFVAQHVVDTLRDCREDGEPVPAYLAQDVRHLYSALRDWTSDAAGEFSYRAIPDTIQHRRLLKEFEKELQFILNGSKHRRKNKHSKASKPAKKHKSSHFC